MLALPASAVLIVLTMLVSAGIRWGFLPRLKPGRSAVHSNTYCKKWLVSHIQESSLNVLHGIYATVFAPFWYRLLGAKVGRDAEISTALGVVPDMLTLGDETFIADAVMLGDEQIDGGWMTMEPTVVSQPQLRRQRQLHPGRHRAAGKRAGRRAHATRPPTNA